MRLSVASLLSIDLTRGAGPRPAAASQAAIAGLLAPRILGGCPTR